MTEGVNYQVNTWLQAQGSFDREVMAAARGADKLGSSWMRMGDSMISVGQRVRGSFGGMAADLAGTTTKALGAGIAGGVGYAAARGIKSLDYLEQGALGLATMYQTFGVADGLERNVELAKAMQHELVAIADASPGTTEDIMEAYSTAAPAMSAVTQDLERQRKLMSSLAVMNWTNVSGSYKQAGADLGRILQGAAGAETQMFKTLGEPIKKAFTEITGEATKSGEAWSMQFNKAVQQDTQLGLQIIEKVFSQIPPEFADAFGVSFGGVLASVQSKLIKLAGDFSRPLFDGMREAMVGLSKDGPFSEEKFGKLREIAFFSGGVLADAFTRGAELLLDAMDYIANNWKRIAEMIRDAGVVAGVAIKSAIVVGMTRHFVGSVMIAAGEVRNVFSTIKESAMPVAEFIGQQIKRAHMGLARGMKGGGSGILGAMGRGAAGVVGKADGSKGPLNIFRGLDKGILKFGALGTTLGSLGIVATMVGTAIGGITVAIAGVGAYFVEHWDRIAGSIVKGLQDGSITLVPLMTSLYTFYLRLVMVGEALMGGSSAVGTVNTGLNFLVSVIDMVSGALSWFIWGLSIMVGGWASLKWAMLGVMSVIVGIVEISNTLGAVSDETLARARGNYAAFSDSVDATFHKADMLAAASEKIGNAQLSALDYKKAEDKAKELEKSLAEALAGGSGGKGGPKKEGRAAAKVKIDKVVVEVDMRDPDPDRLFSQFIPKLEKMADRRVQPYEALEQGS